MALGTDPDQYMETDTHVTSIPIVSRRRLAFKPADRMQTLRSATQAPSSITSKQSHSSIELRSRVSVLNDALTVSRVDNSSEMIARDEATELQDSQKKGKTWSYDEVMVYYEALKQVGKDFDSLVKLLNKKKIRKDKEQVKNYYYNSHKCIRSLIDFDDAMFPSISRDARELFIVINSIEWRKRTGSTKYQVDKLKELIFDGATTVRCKKKTLVFKTPACPALIKYFTRERYIEKHKFPTSINLTLKPKTYTDAALVMASFQNPLLRVNISLNEKITRIFDILRKKWLDSSFFLTNNGVPTRRFCLFSDESVAVGKVVVSQSANIDTSISLNRLKSESEEGGSGDKNPSYRIVTPSPFILSDESICSGLNPENVGEATIMELYCLFGMTSDVALTYSIETDTRTSWDLFCAILDRDFGEAITSSDAAESRRKLPDDLRGKTNSRKIKAPSSINPDVPKSLESDIIIKEAAICMNQVQQLRDRRSRKRRNLMESYSEGFPPVKTRLTNIDTNRYPICTPSLPAATDFSQMSCPDSSTSDFLNSLRTPEKKSKACSSTSCNNPGSSNYNYMELFGKEMSVSPDRSRSILCSSGVLREEDLFGSMSITPSKERSRPPTSFDSESLHCMVSNTVTDMLNQDSIDFYHNFSTLIDDVSPLDNKSAQKRR